MDFTGISFIALMCVTGAVVAAVADVLGRNIGKKKHSIWKMRPRHTATLFTALAGFFIPLITIGILYASSSDVRQMLQEGARAAQTLRKTEGQLRVASAKLEDRQRKADDLAMQAQKLQGQIQEENRKGKILAENNERTTRSLRSAQSELQRSNASARAVKTSLAGIKKNLAVIRSELQGRQKELASTQELNQNAKRRLDELDGYNQTLLIEVEKKETEQKALKTGIERSQDQYDKLLDRTGKEAEALRKQIGESRSELEEVERDLNVAKANLLETNSLAKELESNIMEIRALPLTYGIRDEVARYVLERGASQVEAETAVNRLFSLASKRAEDRGAKAQGPYDAASLFDIYNKGVLALSVEQQKAKLMRQITGQRDQTLLIARARINSFAGEFVRCAIEAYENKVVYSPGEVIAEVRINGNQTDQQIVDQLDKFLHDTLSPKVLRDGIIPVQGATSSIGEVDAGLVSELIQNIKAFNRSVRVQALVTTETRRSDPLRLEFRLR